uniref:Uncharacterized protein n=1 Tax=Octopus bimaculoides TaxID=37653 RepID=A0A0L8GQV9_OCTBM
MQVFVYAQKNVAAMCMHAYTLYIFIIGFIVIVASSRWMYLLKQKVANVI